MNSARLKPLTLKETKMITLATFLMTVSIIGFAYLIGSMHGYDKGANDVERIYKEYK